MDEAPTPAVIGPGPSYYIVDDHHTICALDASSYTDVSVTLNILCDLRHSSEVQFWSYLEKQHWVYLVAHPTNAPNTLPNAISYQQLPTYFDFHTQISFSDDPWRSLAAYSRKVTSLPNAPTCGSNDSKYCERCMYRGCVDGYQSQGSAVFYFEFRWGYFLNDASYYQSSVYWTNTTEYTSFITSYQALPYNVTGSQVDVNSWLNTAALAVSVCRASTTAKYELPVSLYPLLNNSNQYNTLPGYYSGYIALPDDPTCDAASQCS
jgi:hypothetical protein